jgi:uncharacterized protein YggU (UPF0235/DUF167 family)
MRLQIKVVPGASRESVEWFGELLKVKVRAVAEKGRANAAVEQLLAKTLQVARVTVVSGFTSPMKTVEIPGLDAAALVQRLGPKPHRSP